MNTYNVNDKDFLDSNLYKEFINENPKIGYLRIRAYSANGAIPISKLSIIVSIIYKDNKIIFYKGETDESGIIENIKLPAPAINANNLDVPHYTTYDVDATLPNTNLHKIYKVNLYEGIQVVQNINATPQISDTGVPLWL